MLQVRVACLLRIRGKGINIAPKKGFDQYIRTMNIKSSFSIPAAAIAAVVAIMSGCASGQGENGQKEAIPVKVLTLRHEDGISGKNYVGTAEASKTAVLSCSYSGTLRELRAGIGDIVKKGDTIAVIESQNVISAKQMADAVLMQAEDGYQRLSQVYESGSVAEVKMVEVQTQLSRARASAQAAQKALDDCTVKAPFDGVIGEVFAEEGVEMNAIQPLARLMDISSVEISFSVPEKEIGTVAPGEKFTVEVPALGGKTFTGTVISKGISASRLSHSYECKLSPSVKVTGLMPGMVCKVSKASDDGEKIIIPASVVRIDGKGRYVWTVNGENTVEKRYIAVSGFSGKGIVVESGLGEGEKIITEGTQKVSSGMKVKIM